LIVWTQTVLLLQRGENQLLYALGNDQPQLEGENFVAPDASLIGRVRLKRGASVWFQSVLRGDNEWITIGKDSNIQDGSVLHTDIGAPLDIGANVTVGHNVTLHGCQVEGETLIGMGSIILNHAKIGKNTIIGANTLVAEGKEIPPGVLALGAPARVLRDLTAHELKLIALSARFYIENATRFSRDLESVG
jgi:carbonic anhydrase/acetyltransferase-like protein (isoleucine patch superfamily)